MTVILPLDPLVRRFFDEERAAAVARLDPAAVCPTPRCGTTARLLREEYLLPHASDGRLSHQMTWRLVCATCGAIIASTGLTLTIRDYVPAVRHKTAGYAGVEWLKEHAHIAEVSPFGACVANLLGDLFCGLYHWDGWRSVDWGNAQFIRVAVGWKDLATYDSSLLTRLVFLAHDYAIRVEVNACNFHHLELYFHPRARRSAHTSGRHPSLEEAVASWRNGDGAWR